MNTKPLYQKIWKEAKNAPWALRVEPYQIQFYLHNEAYCIAHGNVCTIDIWASPGQFEKTLTAYGRKRAGVCSGGYDGCSGPVRSYWILTEGHSYKAPYCESCHKTRREAVKEAERWTKK